MIPYLRRKSNLQLLVILTQFCYYQYVYYFLKEGKILWKLQKIL